MRTTTLTPDSETDKPSRIRVVRDEPHEIVFDTVDTLTAKLTISDSTHGDALVQISGTGSIEITPASVQALSEGVKYFYNIWVDDVRYFYGPFDLCASISPVDVSATTTFLNNFGQEGEPDTVVTLTQAEYDAMTEYDDGTLYVIEEG